MEKLQNTEVRMSVRNNLFYPFNTYISANAKARPIAEFNYI